MNASLSRMQSEARRLLRSWGLLSAEWSAQAQNQAVTLHARWAVGASRG